MKNMSAEWQGRLKHWLYALRQDLYRPLGAIPLEGFLTMEELAPREASARAFSPMRPGTKWGRSYEYCWLRGRVVLPAEAEGKRIVLAGNPGAPMRSCWRPTRGTIFRRAR